ncbi:unnamed protein product [Brachionus calyciflorus]|uniref:BEN domain-containing protein n=1 Tax=Brachionus calyciflorus TaxID=104777 RepID=A0A814QYC2_9BILA|nr:unnamed protein product [Brachionus calyciflorus]
MQKNAKNAFCIFYINQDIVVVDTYLSSCETIPTTSANSVDVTVQIDQPLQDIELRSISNTDVSEDIQELKVKIDQMLKMVTELLERSRKKGRSNDWPAEIMWNGKNLLDIPASSWNKYLTALMDVLFTKDEMKTGVVILPGEITKSTRPRLSEEKCELLKKCAIAKARPSNDKIEETWKNAKLIANHKCIDSNKKN